MLVDFDTLNNESRVWVYQSNRTISKEETSEIELKINIAINDFALSNNYDLILYENGAFVSTEVDITQEIINLIELHSP